MRIAYYQFCLKHKDPEYNLRKIESQLDRCRLDLVVLPELCTSGYIFNSSAELARYAELIPEGPSTRRFAQMAARGNCYIVAGVPEQDDGLVFNTAIVVGPNGFIGKHRKTTLSNYEKSLFSRGQEIICFDAGDIKIGVAICLESWFPEIARRLMMQGCHILCNPASFGGTTTLTSIRSRAIENMFFTITANRLGDELGSGIHAYFRGDSRIVDCNGDILIRSGTDETIAIVNIDPFQASIRQNNIMNLGDELGYVTSILKGST